MSSEYVCPLSEELQQRAEAELNERPQWRDRDVMALKLMINESPDLSCPTDYLFLLRFLRAKKFDYDRAFAALRRYYDVRTRHPEIFATFLPSSVEHVYKDGIVTVLPRRDAHGRRVLWLRPGLWDPAKCPITDLFKAGLLCMEWIIRDEQTQIDGVVMLEDFNGAGWAHVKQVSRERMRLMTFLVQEAFPIRMKGVNILNSPKPFQYILSIVRLFLKQKLRDRFRVYGNDLRSLVDHFGEDCLPTQYGGKLVVDPQQWANEILSSEADAYFRSRLGDGYVDAVRKQTDAERRLSAGSVTLPGNSPLLVEQQSSVVVSKVDNFEDTMAFTSFSVCQATVDSD